LESFFDYIQDKPYYYQSIFDFVGEQNTTFCDKPPASAAEEQVQIFAPAPPPLVLADAAAATVFAHAPLPLMLADAAAAAIFACAPLPLVLAEVSPGPWSRRRRLRCGAGEASLGPWSRRRRLRCGAGVVNKRQFALSLLVGYAVCQLGTQRVAVSGHVR